MQSLAIFLISIIIYNLYQSKDSALLSLLLLEAMSMIVLAIALWLNPSMSVTSLFILITLLVCEAALGLAVLLKTARDAGDSYLI